MTPEFWITVSAILLGPVIAVQLTRFNDRRTMEKQRKMDIFRALMRTRGAILSSDHVTALNLVEIEFHKNPDVIAAFKALHDHYHNGYQAKPNEELKDTDDPEIIATKNQAYATRVQGTQQKLLTSLLSEMASILKYKKTVTDLFDGSYTPSAWDEVETDNGTIRKFLKEIAKGNLEFPVRASYDAEQIQSLLTAQVDLNRSVPPLDNEN